MNIDYYQINGDVMADTSSLCQSNPVLGNSIKRSILEEQVIYEDQLFPIRFVNKEPKAIVSHLTTFDAAKKYIGKRTTVVSFANNNSVGGSPYSAGAQEETLC
jgi:hypothetical protein